MIVIRLVFFLRNIFLQPYHNLSNGYAIYIHNIYIGENLNIGILYRYIYKYIVYLYKNKIKPYNLFYKNIYNWNFKRHFYDFWKIKIVFLYIFRLYAIKKLLCNFSNNIKYNVVIKINRKKLNLENKRLQNIFNIMFL